MTMIFQRLLYNVMWLTALLLLLAGCRQESLPMGESVLDVPEGFMAITFRADVPDMVEVKTRGVDPDGGGIQDLCLFCFNESGAFITTVEAKITPDGDPSGVNITSGTFQAAIPDNTYIIHFVANQNLFTFDETMMLGKHETEVIPQLVASSGKLIYWQRISLSELVSDWSSALNDGVMLIRNQARITIVKPADNEYTVITGFAVCNTSAYGTVAPYNKNDKNFIWDKNDYKDGYLSLPVDADFQVRLTPGEDVTDNSSRYVFETENTADNPVSIILKDDKGMYYRVLLLDGDGNFLNVRRNTSYNLNLEGALTNGSTSFAAALNGPASNNVWISISDDISTISDGTYELSVENTVFVYETGSSSSTASFSFSYKNMQGMGVDNPELEVAWTENNNVATGLGFNYDPTTGEGTVSFSLNALTEGESVRRAVVQIGVGKLRRVVKIYLIKKFEFIPSWVSTQVDGTQAGESVTLMFTIPEDFPEELFPFDVKIGADALNVREAGGQVLSVITKDSNPDDFTLNDPWNFKFVYRAERAGVQRVYFNTTLPPELEEGATDEYKDGRLTIEADYFETMEKAIPYIPMNRYLTLQNLLSVDGKILGGGMPRDEMVYYRLVPQKINAPVTFTVGVRQEGMDINVVSGDEFVLYSNYLDYYEDNEIPGGISPDCEFFAEEGYSSQGNGHYHVFRPVTGNYGKKDYNIYMKTNRPNSAEVIRLDSNQPGNTVSWWGQSGYNGTTFRSITFELANYNPFRFYGKITNSQGEYTKWTYEPGQSVNVEFDVTSFRGSDNRSANPFGTEFKVYIDAPMLEIDETRRGNYSQDIFFEESDGRFVYLVKADRAVNKIGSGSVDSRNNDKKRSDINISNYPADEDVDQTGEHKILPFRTKSIVSEGTIRINADESVVSFTAESFVITNQAITGQISYNQVPVPAQAFVSIALSDGTRIGSIDVDENGQYSLTLRKEYRYTWTTDPVTLTYRTDDLTYVANYPNLQSLFNRPDVSLQSQE